MALAEEDYENLRAQADADPVRYAQWDPNGQFRREYAGLHPENQHQQKTEDAREENHSRGHHDDEIEHPITAVSSSSTADTEADTARFEGIRSRPSARRSRSSNGYSYDTGIHRSETNRINQGRETHPIALDRISTYRSQHFGTVGTNISTKISRRQLPNFGGGKPYPPKLPAQEEYVVEFDGPDDPIHAQNWPLKKKFVLHLL